MCWDMERVEAVEGENNGVMVCRTKAESTDRTDDLSEEHIETCLGPVNVGRNMYG